MARRRWWGRTVAVWQMGGSRRLDRGFLVGTSDDTNCDAVLSCLEPKGSSNQHSSVM